MVSSSGGAGSAAGSPHAGSSALEMDVVITGTEGERSIAVTKQSDLIEIIESVRDVMDDGQDETQVDGAIFWALVEKQWMQPSGVPIGLMFLCIAGKKPICRRGAINFRKIQSTVFTYCVYFLKRGFQYRCRDSNTFAEDLCW